MRRMLSESGLNRKYSMDKIFLELEKLQMMGIDRKMIENERTEKQKDILESLNSVTCT
ncbi:MAG: hypothetical protein QXU18_10945 [Thermoplasmatales archaeon]